ncbi:MAG: agmatine deiminase family protein [Pseudomonadota bacterium]
MTRRMPAEWEPHARTWMIWPDGAVWQDRLEAAEADYIAVAAAIASFEPVRMVADPASAARARRLLPGEVELLELPVDDAWMRDSGPSFVRGPDGLEGVCWRFNGWGGAAPAFAKDAALARALLAAEDIPAVTSALAMEGGALHVDGEGTLLTTESVVLNPNRNPGLTKAHAEAEFARALGAEKVLWLPGDAEEFGTDGHIDGLACFTAPGKILFEQAHPEAPGRPANDANLAALKAARDAAGRPLEITILPGAPPLSRAGSGDWGYCASYVNFYVANGGVVAPRFGLPEDDAAREIIAETFPGRDVVQVDVSSIAFGGGGIHCITQQQPAA